MPLHALAIFSIVSWPLLFVGRKPSVRLVEVFLALWAMCWFTTEHPFAASADCIDTDASCHQWAASGECTKNKDFMLKTCRKACGECVGDSSDGSFARLGPRAVVTAVGGALVILAVARLVLSGLSDASQQRVATTTRIALRPLAFCASIIMRTPLAPLLRVVFRVLRGAIGAVGTLLRYAWSCGALTGCANLMRRQLIVVLGGQVDRGASVDGLFDKGR